MPALRLDPARGPVLWTVLGIGAACAAVVLRTWVTQAPPHPFITAVLLVSAAWLIALAASRAKLAAVLRAATPYFVAGASLLTLAVLQVAGDPSDVAHTNALLGAYLALPVAYLLFFLLRPPTPALVGSLLTWATVVTLQATLPPILIARYATGSWMALFTGFWHGAVIVLLFAVPRLRSDRDLLFAVMRSSRDAVVLLMPASGGSASRRGSRAPTAPFSVLFTNGAAERTFGVQQRVDLTANESLGPETDLHACLAEAHETQAEVTITASLRTLAGPRWFRVTGSPFRGGVAATFVDVTEHKESESQALALALTDPLTGVANRRGFEGEAARRIAEAGAAGRQVTLCYLDLDGFKAINDRYGHEAGDRILQIAAERLRTVVRASDLIARLGGDEFAILADGLESGAVAAFFDRVHAALETPFDVSGREFQVHASLGVVTHADELSPALAKADSAMYSAKQSRTGVAVVSLGA